VPTASDADLSVGVKELPKSRVELTFEVPAQRVDAAYDRVLQRLAQRVKIEGFRPGKAPRAVLEARLGPTALREEVIDALVPETVAKALVDREIDAVDRPQVEVGELERGRPGRFTATVTVRPEVALPDLRTLEVERPATNVDDELVERRIGELLERRAILEPVERELAVGDIAVLDLDVLVDGEPVPDEERRASEIEVREGVLIPELLTALPGARVDETREAEVELPAEHPDANLAGKKATVRATLRGVKEKHLPELDDELAKELSDGAQDTVDAFRAAVRADLEETAKRVEDMAFEQAAVRALVERSQTEVPDALVDRELDRRLEDLEHALGHQGLRLDAYLGYQNLTEAEWRERQREDAAARVLTELVLDALAKQEQIEPAAEEVTAYMAAEIERDAQLRDRSGELLGSRSARDFFERRLRRQRTLEKVVELAAGGTEKPS
jgi:trigger factor